MIHDKIFDFLERQAIHFDLPKDKLTVECALALADAWSEELEDEDSCRIKEPEGWRMVCKVLADEVRQLQVVVSQSSIKDNQL